MLAIKTKPLKISDELKRKIEIIGRFTNTKPNFKNSSIINIVGTNIAYVEQVSNEAKYIFLNENLRFAINNNKIYLNNNKINLYISNDGSSKFNYKNNNVEYISVKETLYYEESKLKIKCSVYQINSNKNKYKYKELIFISNDKDLTWNL